MVHSRFESSNLFHANSYLWAVAHEIHDANTSESRRWVKPLLRQLRTDKVAKVIARLEDLKPRLSSTTALRVEKTIDYYTGHQSRMKYVDGERRGEPVGSGATELTRRELQCRLKQLGDALLAFQDRVRSCQGQYAVP